MTKKIAKIAISKANKQPTFTLIKSESPNIDSQKKSEEIRYYLTHIMILADKNGRPAKTQFPEVANAS